MGFDYNITGALARPFNDNAETVRVRQSPWQRLLNLRAAEQSAAAERPVSRFVDMPKFAFVQSLLPAPVRGLAASRFYTPAPVAAPAPPVAVVLTLKGKTEVFKRAGSAVTIEVPSSVAQFSDAARLKAKTEVFRRNGQSIVVQAPSSAALFAQAAARLSAKTGAFKRNGASIVVQLPSTIAPFTQVAKAKTTLSLSRPVNLVAPAAGNMAAPAAEAGSLEKRATLSLGAKVTKAELPTFENISKSSTLQQFGSVFKATEQNVIKSGGIEAASRPAASFSVAQKSRKSWAELIAEAEAQVPKKTFADIDFNAAVQRETQSLKAREQRMEVPVARPAAAFRAPGLAA